jgi:hypothetical protein
VALTIKSFPDAENDSVADAKEVSSALDALRDTNVTTPPTFVTLSVPSKDPLLVASVELATAILYAIEYALPGLVGTVITGEGGAPTVDADPVTNVMGIPLADTTKLGVGDENPGMASGFVKLYVPFSVCVPSASTIWVVGTPASGVVIRRGADCPPALNVTGLTVPMVSWSAAAVRVSEVNVGVAVGATDCGIETFKLLLPGVTVILVPDMSAAAGAPELDPIRTCPSASATLLSAADASVITAAFGGGTWMVIVPGNMTVPVKSTTPVNVLFPSMV